MAKVNITFKDRADGTVSFRVTSHPVVRDGDELTPAQKVGKSVLEQLQMAQQSVPHMNKLQEEVK